MQPKFSQSLNVVVHSEFRTWLQAQISAGHINSACAAFKLPGDTNIFTTVNGVFLTTHYQLNPGKIGGFDLNTNSNYKIGIGTPATFIQIPTTSPISCDLNDLPGGLNINPKPISDAFGYSTVNDFALGLATAGPAVAYLTDNVNMKESIAIFGAQQYRNTGGTITQIHPEWDITDAGGGIVVNPSTLDWVVDCISGISFSCNCSNGQFVKAVYPIACPNVTTQC